jgi:flagella basal body P-ring formation protein FlgA
MQKKVICLTLVAILLPTAYADEDHWTAARLINVATNYARRVIAVGADSLGDAATKSSGPVTTLELAAAPLDARLVLPRCGEQPALRLEVQNSDVGRVLVSIHCSTPTDWTVPIGLTVQTESDVYVLTRPIGSGETPDITALRIERRKLPGLPDAMLRPPTALEGFVTRRALAAGEALRRQDLSQRPWIKRGDTATVIARATGLEVRSEAIALADARPGETVRLRYPVTGRALQGQATGPGIALAPRGQD